MFSLSHGPMTCSPKGIELSERQTGTEIAGSPARNMGLLVRAGCQTVIT